MIPPLIVARALAQGLTWMAVTDHNSSANCGAVMEAASGAELVVLPGMEVQSREEVHILCLFDDLDDALAWQEVVYDHLPDAENPEDILGAQFVVDAEGEYLRTEQRLLLTSADLALDDIAQRVTALGGIAIPAHIDRPAFSLLTQLGFVPPGLNAATLECFRLTDPEALRRQHPDLAGWPLIRSSDAHRLAELAPSLEMQTATASIVELQLALNGVAGRSFRLFGPQIPTI